MFLACDMNCFGGCDGPGPYRCKTCKGPKDEFECVKECPLQKYNTNGECENCNCNQNGTKSTNCDADFNHIRNCDCKDGYRGEKCDQCMMDYYAEGSSCLGKSLS